VFAAGYYPVDEGGRMPDRVLGWIEGRLRALRVRVPWLDHAWRALLRYDQVRGYHLSAAITYYTFLALFPLLLLAYAVLGYVVGRDAAATRAVSEFLAQNLPTLDVAWIAGARYSAGVVGLIGVLYAGLGWIGTVREAIHDMWGQGEEEGSWWLTKVVDIGVLIALAPITAASIVLSVLVNGGAEWLLRKLGVEGALSATLPVVAFAGGVMINFLLFIVLLAGLPRLRMSWSRLVGPALLGAVLFEVLKTFSGRFLGLTMANPAYKLVASAVGVLVFLNLVNNLLLLCAALTATSSTGEVRERRAFSARVGRIRTRPARRVLPGADVGGAPVASSPPP
jgi:membrane protein